MMQPGLSLQQAMLTALRARPTLTALLGGAHIYDELPRGANPPFVVFSNLETRDWSVMDQKAHECFITLDITTNQRSRLQVQTITQEIETALDGASLNLTDHRLVNLRCVFNTAFRNKNADVFNGTMRFRAATEPL
jgi:Protein of unknown function (DUF3168)